MNNLRKNKRTSKDDLMAKIIEKEKRRLSKILQLQGH